MNNEKMIQQNAFEAFYALSADERVLLLDEFKVTELYHMFAEDIEVYNEKIEAYDLNIEILKNELDRETKVKNVLVNMKKKLDEFSNQREEDKESNPVKEDEKQQESEKKEQKSEKITPAAELQHMVEGLGALIGLAFLGVLMS